MTHLILTEEMGLKIYQKYENDKTQKIVGLKLFCRVSE